MLVVLIRAEPQAMPKPKASLAEEAALAQALEASWPSPAAATATAAMMTRRRWPLLLVIMTARLHLCSCVPLHWIQLRNWHTVTSALAVLRVVLQ